MRKILLAAAALAVVAPLAAVTDTASANVGSPGCVTRKEYLAVHNGMKASAVMNRFGTVAHPYHGTVTFRADDNFSHEIDREWVICNRLGKPGASYNTVEVDFYKEINWETNVMPAGPLRSNYKSWMVL